MANALVIGASGQVGGALMAVLAREGFLATGTGLSRADGLRQLDVRDAKAVAACVAETKPEIIFLAASVPGGVDFCEEHPEEAEAVFTRGTAAVLEAASRVKAKIVYYSSDYVFDGKNGPYAEDEPPSPLSAYGKAKARDEKAVLAYQHGALLIRTTAVYSWDRGSKNYAMTVWDALSAGNRLKSPDDQWCNPTLAEYVAETTVRLVQEKVEGVVNVVGKDRVTRAEFAAALAKTFLLDPALVAPTPTRQLAQRAKRPLQAGLITLKCETLLGTQALGLDESLKRVRRAWRADTHVTAAPKQARGPATSLKADILNKVREYHRLAHAAAPFVPGRSRVNYAGRVYGEQEMVNLVDSALDFWLTLGPYGDRFERKMAEFFSARDFVLVNSGSTANLTAVMTLTARGLDGALKPGDEVITPAVTFPTTVAPLVHGGLVPVFVDCEIGSYNINPHLIAKAISRRTRAMLIPHTLGNPCDMDIITTIAREKNLFLIEDGCDALGATFRGKLAGSFGELSTLSFFPAHHIMMGEGGGVVVNAARLARTVRSVRDWGRDCWCAPGESNTCGKRFGWKLGDLPRGYDHKYTYSNLGYNFKPTDMQAAIGVAQAERIGDFVAARRRNFDKLYAGLKAYEDRLILPTLDPRSRPSWFGFPITVRDGVRREELVAWLENANIETRVIFGGNILRQPGYRGIPMREAGPLEQTDRVLRDTFFIGVYPGLSDAMIAHALKTFAGFFASRTRQARA